MKKDTFVLNLKVTYTKENVYVVYNTSLKRALREIKKIRTARTRYETGALYRACLEKDGDDQYVSPGKLVCEYQLMPKYYSRSKGEFYF